MNKKLQHMFDHFWLRLIIAGLVGLFFMGVVWLIMYLELGVYFLVIIVAILIGMPVVGLFEERAKVGD